LLGESVIVTTTMMMAKRPTLAKSRLARVMLIETNYY
jgi:hypothetical protein